MIDVANGWIHGVERGPGWLFIRLNAAPKAKGGAPTLADSIWNLAEQHFVYRIVLECDDVQRLTQVEVDELGELRDRLDAHGGVMRLCGLSPTCVDTIENCGMSQVLPHYDGREDAVLAHRPTQPR
ncbi:MAG TPA: STAS domain-containing protein [Pirellulales bacterium]|nr:STAS domain-containing protein [Pirellulales bacterium]